jgi:dephospho-CoA kinase
MYRLALTGSIATGKSTVLGLFADQDIPIYSADTAVHELYQAEAVAPVAALCADCIVDGVVDREKLSAFLVADPVRIKTLEAIVHPLVRKKMTAFLQECDKQGHDLAVLEIPLLFETGADYPVDGIAVTTCSDQVQHRRAMARPGMSAEKLATIIARQLPQSEKRARADFIIDTAKSLADTKQVVMSIIAACRQKGST